MTIGTRIREQRIKKDINQTNLAKIAGSSSQMISLIESDKNKPTLELLTELSKIFGVTTDYLLTGSEGITEISAEEKEVIEIMRLDDAFKNAVKQAINFKKRTISYLNNYKPTEAHLAQRKICMSNFETIDAVIDALDKENEFPDNYETYGDVVNELLEMGSTDKVFAFHDDHLGLKDSLSDEFLNSEISDDNNQKYESEIVDVLEQAEIIIPLFEKELSEDDIEEIIEDKRSRGDNS